VKQKIVPSQLKRASTFAAWLSNMASELHWTRAGTEPVGLILCVSAIHIPLTWQVAVLR